MEALKRTTDSERNSKVLFKAAQMDVNQGNTTKQNV